MRRFLIAITISLVVVGLAVGQSTNVSNSLDDYIAQNQRLHAARIEQFEAVLANFKTVFSQRQQLIILQADFVQLKLEDAAARIEPLGLIDPWHRQCVQKYSSIIPTIATARLGVNQCQATINYIPNYAESKYYYLKNYYNINLKNSLADCVQNNSSTQLNYTLCVTTVIAAANSLSNTYQNNFNTQIKDANCTAESRIRAAWTAQRLIDNCIDNQLVCGSVSCSAGCPNVSTPSLTEGYLRNETIRNPLRGLSTQAGCREFRFK